MVAAADGDVRLLELNSGHREAEALEHRFLSSGARNLVIDFADCRYFGAATLSLMLRLRHAVDGRGGRMVLCNVSPYLRDVLQVTGLDSLWMIYRTRSEAIEAGQRSSRKLYRIPPSSDDPVPASSATPAQPQP